MHACGGNMSLGEKKKKYSCQIKHKHILKLGFTIKSNATKTNYKSNRHTLENKSFCISVWQYQ